MVHLKKLKSSIIIWVLVIFAVLTSCNSLPRIYKGSFIDEEFPIPIKAVMTDDKSNSPNIIYVRYNLDRSELPPDYFTTISKWGWHSDEGYGAYRLYKKGDKKIGMTIHNEFIALFKEKE